ncbi:MAG: hypothetical protein AAGA43_13380 [Bacteroidota bacterium]
MFNKYEDKPHQIDFINDEITTRTDLVSLLNENSLSLEHLLDEKPKLIRWHFKDFGSSLKVIVELSKESELTYRWICLEANALFFQHGHFD